MRLVADRCILSEKKLISFSRTSTLSASVISKRFSFSDLLVSYFGTVSIIRLGDRGRLYEPVPAPVHLRNDLSLFSFTFSSKCGLDHTPSGTRPYLSIRCADGLIENEKVEKDGPMHAFT